METISRVAWSGFFRVISFWLLVIGVVASLDAALLPLDITMNVQVAQQAIGNAMAGNGDGAADAISQPAFAISLALLLGVAGVGLLAAYLLMHAIAVRISIAMLTRLVSRYRDRKAFADAYESAVYPKLHRHPLIGHAWKEFDETFSRMTGRSTASWEIPCGHRALSTPDAIVCLECSQPCKSLKRHLQTSHNLSPQAYRDKWGLPADYPMVAPNYSARRRSRWASA